MLKTFTISHFQIEYQILNNQLDEWLQKAHTVRYLLLTGQINIKRYQTYDLNEISFEMRKLRRDFYYMYQKYLKCQNTLNSQYDIIEKDVARIDPHFFKNCQFNNTYPNFNSDTYRKAIKLILILLIQFHFSQIQTSNDKIELQYLQGMHEIVAYVLFISINQLSQFTNNELNKLNFIVSSSFQDVIADAYNVSKALITLLLPLYNQQSVLTDMSIQCEQYVHQSEDQDFQKQIQKSTKQLPDFVTFCQKSFKLMFLRDFDQQTTLKVWDFILSVNRIIQESSFSFMSYFLSQIFVFRIKNRKILNLKSIFEIFVPSSLDLGRSIDFNDFLYKTVKNFITIQGLDFQIVVVQKNINIQDFENSQIIEKINPETEIQSFYQNQVLIEKISELLGSVTQMLDENMNIDDKEKKKENLTRSIINCQNIKGLLDYNLSVSDVEDANEQQNKNIYIQTPEQLIDQVYIAEKIYHATFE